jgi:hypothetical protein
MKHSGLARPRDQVGVRTEIIAKDGKFASVQGVGEVKTDSSTSELELRILGIGPHKKSL